MRFAAVRYGTGDARPRGEGYNKSRIFKFMRFAAVRYETGDARPRGEGYNKGRIYKFMRYAAVRYGTGDARPPGGRLETKADFLNLCDMQQSVMERAIPAPSRLPLGGKLSTKLTDEGQFQ